MAVGKTRLSLKREKGSVVVEMAIALPLLLMIVAGIIDLGLLFWEKEVLTNAAREGARAGARAKVDATAELTQTQVRTLVQTYLRNYNIKDAAGALITLTTSNCVYTRDITDPTNPTLSIELRNIPVRMMMLPSIQNLFPGTPVSNVIYLNAKITMASEW
jgi:Flp pilus assembly protein TadG